MSTITIVDNIASDRVIDKDGRDRGQRVTADLHNDVTYEGWGKTSAAGHREIMHGKFQTRAEKIHQFATRKDRSSPCAKNCYPERWCFHE